MELRVGLGVDEYRAFHSPLFASTETNTSASLGASDGKDVTPAPSPLSSSARANRDRDKMQRVHVQNVQNDGLDWQDARLNRNVPGASSSFGSPFASSEPQVHHPHKRSGLNGREASGMADGNADGNTTEMNLNGRDHRVRGRIKLSTDQLEAKTSMATAVLPPSQVLPPTPPSPPFRDDGDRLRDARDELVAQSITSHRPDDHWFASSSVADESQTPTPPTSIDGHGHVGSPNATIASVLGGEESNDFVHQMNESEMNGRRVEKNEELSSNTSHIHSTRNQKPQPKVQTDDLFYVAPPSHPHVHDTSTKMHAPMSPPQSPPQLQSVPSISSISSHSQTDVKKRSKSRSKSRTRADTGGSRPGTASSAISTGSNNNYVPPSSASSSDGLGSGRSPSALSALRPFASTPSPSSPSSPGPRKLTKHRAPKNIQPVDTGFDFDARLNGSEYGNGYDAGPKTPRPAQGNELLVDEDPFAKDTISTPVTPPAPPFASSQYAYGGSPVSSVPSSPAAADDYFTSRARRRGEKLDAKLREAALKTPVPTQNGLHGYDALHPSSNGHVQEPAEEQPQEPEEPAEPTFYPIQKHLMEASLLEALLPYLTMRDWNALTASNDAMRRAVEHKRELRELVLERFLGTVGYERWRWPTKEHIMLTFRVSCLSHFICRL